MNEKQDLYNKYLLTAKKAEEKSMNILNPDKILKQRAQEKIRKTEKMRKRMMSGRSEQAWEPEREASWQSCPGQDHSEAVQIKSPEAARKTEKERNKSSEMPSLYECAQKILEKMRIICIGDMLYCFNGRCYQPMSRNELITAYRRHVSCQLHGARNMRLFQELYNCLLTDPRIARQPDLSQISDLAILKNGIYDVRKECLTDFNPDVTAFSYVNASFVRGRKCPAFDSFINDITGGNPILQERLWMALGYIFTLSLDAKVFFVMGQAPNSGKSLLGKFVQNVYEPGFVSSVALMDFNKEFSLAPLVGKAINISLDLPGSKLSASAVSKLKMLTGGDAVTIDEKYVPQFQYQNRAKLLFATNHPIQLTEKDDAFWERLVFLPFDYTVRKEDRNEELLAELLAEKDAVVSKALKYAGKLMKMHYCFPTTEEIDKRIMEWRGDLVDSIDAFIRECCDVDEDWKGELVEDLYTRYLQFCAKRDEKPKKRAELKGYMEKKMGFIHFKMRRQKSDNPQSAFKGIKLRDWEDAYC